MKQFLLVAILLLQAGALLPQQLIRNFGNNHITTASFCFSSDGKLLLTGGFPRFYNMTTGNIEFRTIPRDTETQADYTFETIISHDRRTFTITKLNRIEIWDFQGRKKLKDIRDNQLVTRAIGYTCDDSKILYLRKNGELVFIDMLSFSLTVGRNTGIKEPVLFTMSPDCSQLIAGTKNGEISKYDITTGNLTTLTAGAAGIVNIELSAAGNYIAISSDNGSIWLGKYPSLEIVSTWQSHPEGQTVISFHPTGKFLASGGKDRMIRIWNIPGGSLEREWEAHNNPLASVAFSPSGEMVATGSVNTFLSVGIDDTKIWSFEYGAPQPVSKAEQAIPGEEQKQEVTPPISPANQNNNARRLALVIGNGNYMTSVLANPENDARAMKTALEQSGFDVIKYENLGQSGMKRAMDEFGARLKNYDVGLFFYAGHGIQYKGYNYLIPVDADLKSEEQVEYDCVQADRILGLMEGSGSAVNIIILDACRNNPFERSWTRSASERGLAYMDAPGGTLIAYATAPGRTASDGSGSNGLYTSAILECIRMPDISILQMFQNVRNIVSQKSAKQQIPWESTSLTGDFYFYRSSQDND